MSHAAARTTVASGERQAGGRWPLLILLVASICINYIDRANLSVAADELGRELSLGPERIGVLLSAFFWTYAAFQIPSGWLIDRFNVYWVYALGYFIWSTATALTGWAGSFSTIFGLRLLLGAAESVAYPSYSKIIACTFEERQRGLANALIDAGSKMGPYVGLLIGGTIVANYGWRVMFLSIGLVSLLWLLPWCVLIRRETGHATKRIAHDGPSLAEIFTKREAWGTFFGLLCSNYAWYFLLTWLPLYLIRERHFSTDDMAVFGSIPFLGVALASLFGGWASDFLIGRGFSPTLVRKGFVITGLLMATLLLPAALAPTPNLSITLLTIACLCFGLFTSNVWAVTQRLAGIAAAGKWTGIQNTFGNISGVVAPYVTGRIVEETHSFLIAFIAACGILVLGACSYIFLVKRVEPVRWRAKA
jgi:ACS family D-galactonate transporter-like MFS transporter